MKDAVCQESCRAGWVCVRSALPCAIGGNKVTCAAGCLLTGEMWIDGLPGYIGSICVFEGLYALLRDGCVSVFGCTKEHSLLHGL